MTTQTKNPAQKKTWLIIVPIVLVVMAVGTMYYTQSYPIGVYCKITHDDGEVTCKHYWTETECPPLITDGTCD